MTDEMRISIGGICVGLLVDDPGEAARLRERYGLFLSQDSPSLAIEVVNEERNWPMPAGPGNWPLSTTRSGSLLHIESLGEETVVDLAAGKGRLAKAPGIPGENSLRVVFSWLCVSQGCLLLHSSGVVRDGQGYLFFGPSGAGKSTVARLCRDLTVLSDDLVMVRRVNGSFHAQGVPFRGEALEVPVANTHAPLSGVFRLAKDERNYIEPVAGSRMLATLLASVPFVMDDQLGSQKAAETCAQVLGAVPHGRLHFRRDGGFWEAISDSKAGRPGLSIPSLS